MKFSVQAGKLTVKARSSVHDTTTTWDKVSGTVDADPDAIEAAKAKFTVDMTSFDAGDWLKNRKLRKDFAMEDHPAATFTLDRVSDVVRDGQKFTAKAHGTLSWRGKDVVLELAGQGTLDRERLEARATFVLDIKRLGLQPPKFFIFKVEDEVSVEVSVRGGVAV
jgi:polyisoprenoid-binding protein YceI